MDYSENAQYTYFWTKGTESKSSTGCFFDNLKYALGKVKFPKFLNTPPQNLQMVDLVWASAKKFDFNPSNQPRIGLQHFMWLNLQYKTKKLTRPNFKIPFDYNLLFLVVVHENIVCPTTFIAKTWKFMGTSVY